MAELKIKNRKIGPSYSPLIIAEMGINHEGSINKALKMVDDAYAAGAECIKMQIHYLEDEMIPLAKKVAPGHTKESIWDIMNRCLLSDEEHIKIKRAIEKKGMIYLATPFSRKAANFLEKISAPAFKIGSGECNNYPLIEHIARFKKPIILSTGMNDISAIKRSVDIIRKHKLSYSILHCTSLYPTPYEKVRLGAMVQLMKKFPDAVVGLSDHSVGIFISLAAVALKAYIIEKHFTSSKKWKGPDINISINTAELKELINGSLAIKSALGGRKRILKEELPTIRFAFSSVVSVKKINKGDKFSLENIWVKRPGTGEIKAVDFERLLGKRAKRDIDNNSQINWRDVK